MKFYLIGIKGSGMAALAQILVDDGYSVEGKDTEHILLTDEVLKKKGIKIYSLTDKSYLNADVIVIGHTFMNQELIDELNENHKMFLEYHEFLNFYLEKKKLIAVAGSHGKTTTIRLLETLDEKSSFLCGDGTGRKIEKDHYFFLEACEYKEHFLAYEPKELIITNIDYDHVDYFKTKDDYVAAFQKFVNKVPCIFINEEDQNKVQHPHKIVYGLSSKADYYPGHILEDRNIIEFDVYDHEKKLNHYSIPNYGQHFLEHFISVVAFYNEHRFNLEKIQIRMEKYVPPHQRFNIIQIGKNFINVDYAHHPSQIEANYELCKEKYAKYIKVAVFRGDRFSRINYFKNEIIQALEKYDLAFVLPLATMKENETHDEKELQTKKIIYLNKIEEIKNYLNSENKYSISLMSSKPFFEEIEYMKSIL